MINASGLAAVAQSIVLVASSIHGGSKTGSGFIIASTKNSSQILTAAHVVAGEGSTSVYLRGPRGQRYSATVLRADPLRDLALLEISVGNLTPLSFASDALPTSGTSVEVFGYPTASKPKMMLSDLKLVTVAGKVDGEVEQGESLLFDIAVTHGDSGAPAVDVTSGLVIAMILGQAGGYGSDAWMTGDGRGAGVAAIDAFLHPLLPEKPPAAPAFRIGVDLTSDSSIASSVSDFGVAGGFIPIVSRTPDNCASGNVNAVLEETPFHTSGSIGLSIALTDCSGVTIFQDASTGEAGGYSDMARVLDRELIGFADLHRAEWTALLRYGIAVDPGPNPYLALMSLERNPYGQLKVGHLFRGGPADVAGLRAGDAVLKIDGYPTRSLGSAFMARLLNEPNATILMAREGVETTVTLHPRRFADLTRAGPVPR